MLCRPAHPRASAHKQLIAILLPSIRQEIAKRIDSPPFDSDHPDGLREPGQIVVEPLAAKSRLNNAIWFAAEGQATALPIGRPIDLSTKHLPTFDQFESGRRQTTSQTKQSVQLSLVRLARVSGFI